MRSFSRLQGSLASWRTNMVYRRSRGKKRDHAVALQDGPLQGTPRSKEMGVYERLREQILSLELLPGERISERALEGRLSSSRTPIREALLRLEGEGLVVRDGRSQRVSPIEVAELLEVFEYREAIEAAAVGLACRRARPEQLRSEERRVGKDSVAAWVD